MSSDNIMDKLNDILSNPEAVNAVTQMLSNNDNNSGEDSSNAEMISKIQNVASAMNDKSDPKINLLVALKPYMNNSRSMHIEKAIKMLKMTKITAFLKDL